VLKLLEKEGHAMASMLTLKELLDQAKRRGQTDAELAQQKISFIYGNANIERDRLTPATVTRASARDEPTKGRGANTQVVRDKK
jgi:hypothetical protein